MSFPTAKSEEEAEQQERSKVIMLRCSKRQTLRIELKHAKTPEQRKRILAKLQEIDDEADPDRRIGLQKLKEKFQKPLSEQMQEDLSTPREDKEGVEDQSAILDDIRTELRKLSHQLDVIVHLLQIDRIYKTPEKRREAQKLLMRKVREKERAEQ